MELFFNDDKVTIKNASIDDLTNFMKLMNHSNVSDISNVSNVSDNIVSNSVDTSETINNNTEVISNDTEGIDTNVVESNNTDISILPYIKNTKSIDINRKVELLRILEKDHSKKMIESISHNENIPINTIRCWINKYIASKKPLKYKNNIVYQCEVPYIRLSNHNYKIHSYSDELRNMIIEEIKADRTHLKEISLRYNIHISTLYGWIKKYIDNVDTNNEASSTESTTIIEDISSTEDTTLNSSMIDTINDETISYEDWRLKVIYPLVDKIDSNRKVVLSKMYKQMNSIYGIVWEQLYKDYIKYHGTRATSTLRSIYYLEKEVPFGTYGNEHYENILENLLKQALAEKNKLS